MPTNHLTLRQQAPILVLAAGLTACGSNPVEPTLDQRLFGAWEWVRAEGGIAGVVITPDTEGFNLVLRFTRPNRVELFRDDVMQVATTFELLPARLRYAEPVFGFEEQEVGFDTAGRLLLIDPCCDGFAYTWEARLEGDS